MDKAEEKCGQMFNSEHHGIANVPPEEPDFGKLMEIARRHGLAVPPAS